MGTIVNGIYLPTPGESNWGEEVNDNFRRVSDLAVNVKAHGAVGNGVVDDTAAIQAAITAVTGLAGTEHVATVYFPAGTYKITSTIDLSAVHGLQFLGGGAPSNLMAQPMAPNATIDARTITTGPAFTCSPTYPNNVVSHNWENITILGGRTCWFYNDSVEIRFRNVGGRVFTDDGNADNAPIVLQNSFWIEIDGGSLTAGSTSDYSVILRGTSTGALATNTYLVDMRRTKFTFGGVLIDWQPSAAISNCYAEDVTPESFNTKAFLTIVETGSHASTVLSGFMLNRVSHADQTGSCPLIEINATNLILQRPILMGCGQGIANPGILVTAGAVRNARIMGSPNTQYGSFVQTGAGAFQGMQRDKDHGTDVVDTDTVLTETALTGRDGPFYRFAQNGDAYARFGMDTTGKLYWGPGGATSTGWDATFYRSGVGVLRTDHILAGGIAPRPTVLTDAATVAVNAASFGIFRLNTALSRTIGAPTGATAGSLLIFEIRNSSAGAITTSWNATYHLAGAWVDPAAGMLRTISFYYTGSVFYEMCRSAADITP